MMLAKALIQLFCQHHYVLLNITLKLIHHLSASVKSASLSCLSLFCLPKSYLCTHRNRATKAAIPPAGTRPDEIKPIL